MQEVKHQRARVHCAAAPRVTRGETLSSDSGRLARILRYAQTRGGFFNSPKVLRVQGPQREPERLLGIDLLRGLGQTPLQRREWILLRALGQGPVRWPPRDPGRVLLWVWEQSPARALAR
jgi:hypothetical protein